VKEAKFGNSSKQKLLIFLDSNPGDGGALNTLHGALKTHQNKNFKYWLL
jgi:hypothetical protein